MCNRSGALCADSCAFSFFFAAELFLLTEGWMHTALRYASISFFRLASRFLVRFLPIFVVSVPVVGMFSFFSLFSAIFRVSSTLPLYIFHFFGDQQHSVGGSDNPSELSLSLWISLPFSRFMVCVSASKVCGRVSVRVSE